MAGVYLSYPFCAQKCTYCNFASGVFPDDLQAGYLRALEREIGAAEWPWTPETVYLGGGTPGSMNTLALERLLRLVPGRPWREATLEAAPGTVTVERIRGWRAACINRVSLGVQSFVDAELRRTGRRHDASKVAREIALLSAEGLPDINLDLIVGLPGQTASGWRESLDWIERLAPPHVSIYMLEVDEDSRLGKELLGGGVRYGALDVPGEDQIASYYEEAVERLRLLGLERYEISNFARPGRESIHNLKYWKLEPFAGFGADAHSFDGRRRWQNVETAPDYCARIEAGHSPRAGACEADAREERFFVGLRLVEGIEPQPAEWEHWRAPIAKFIAGGLLERDGPRLRLTSRGILLSNEVFAEFIEA